VETNVFKIETKKIPIPEPRALGYRGKYPFIEMKVGDSFFVPLISGKEINIRNAASVYGKRLNRVFTVRRVNTDKVDGVRVWRIK
jgi:hypothetical protein